jgi:hypothetical protein
MLNFHFMILVKPALLTCVHSDLIHRQAYGTFILRLAPAVCLSLGSYCSLFALPALWRWGICFGALLRGIVFIVPTGEICILFRLRPQGGDSH